MAIAHLHDRGYKRLFSNKNFLKQLLHSFVPAEWVQDLDFERCEQLDKSYVSEEYRETSSDLLYKIPLRGQMVFICILMEFQSTVPRFMAVRVAHYIISFYMHLIESNKKLTQLPPVFPIVLYNGEDNWTAPTQLAELIEDHHLLGKFALDFQYFKIVEKEIPVAQLQRVNNLVSTLFLADSHYDLDKVIQALLCLFDQEQHEDVLLLIEWYLQQVYAKKRTVEDYEALRAACQSKQEAKSMLEKVIEREREKQQLIGESRGIEQGIKQGIEQGIVQGIKQGVQQNRLDTAKAMLLEHIELPTIIKCTGLSETEIIRLRDEINPH